MLSTPASATRKVTIACIDCYSTASLYPMVAEGLFKDIEIEWVYVSTHPYSEGIESFLKNVPMARNRVVVDTTKANWIETAETELRARGVEKILYGMDKGAENGAPIAARFGQIHNPLDAIEGYRNKETQGDLLREYKIPTARFTSVNDAVDFAHSFKNKEIVIKPAAGACGGGMGFFCKRSPDFKTRLKARLESGEKNYFGLDDVLIMQPRILGNIYFSNYHTNAQLGITVNTSIAQYNMPDWNSGKIYFLDNFLSQTSKAAKRIRPHADKIREYLRIAHGTEHLELIEDPEAQHFYVLEDNVRIPGVAVSWVARLIHGIGELELNLLDVLDPERLVGAMDLYPLPMHTNGSILLIPAPYDAVISREGVEIIQSLRSYQRIAKQYDLEAGKEVKETTGQDNPAMLIHLTGNRIQPDVARVIDLIRKRKLFTPTGSFCAQKVADLTGRLTDAMERGFNLRHD